MFSWARLARVLWVGYNDGKELSSLVWVLLVRFVRSFTQKVDIKACIIHFLLYLCVNNKHNSQLSP